MTTHTYATRGWGKDTIPNFAPGTDKIDLSALNVADFATLSRYISTDSLGNAVIKLGFGGSYEWITLEGVSASSLNASSFIFNGRSSDLTVNGTTIYDDVLFGGNGSDTLNGQSGSDTLNGGAGNDKLIGMGGDDTLVGGAGSDIFAYIGREFGRDTIKDFAPGTDKIDLSALNVGDFNTLSRYIFTDSLGNAVIKLGYGGSYEWVTLEGVSKASLNASSFIFNTNPTSLTVNGTTIYDDFLFGGNGNDTLNGFSGDDTLNGGSGNDKLVGMTGDDTLVGGAGSDTLAYTDREFGRDTIKDFAPGTDKIDLSLLNVADFTTLSRFISQDSLGNAVIKLGFGGSYEWITLEGVSKASLNASSFIFNTNSANLTVNGTTIYDDVLFGGNGNDTLNGQSGDDTLSGGAGNDKLIGMTGDDTLVGGLGSDTFAYTAREFGRDTIADLKSVDKIDLSLLNVADFATLSRFITQDANGNAVIKLGFGGSYEWITLNGVSKAALNASHFIFNTDATGLTVDGTSIYDDVLFGGNGGDTLNGYSGADNLNGGAGNDILYGMAGNDTLNGGSGNDSMQGGTGNDAYYVSATGDQTIEAANEGTDTVRSYINWALGANIERLELQGAGHLNGTGNALANTLVGNSGNNILNGGSGNDSMAGGGGNDIYIVAAAGDTTTENVGGGTDTVRSYISWALGANFERLELQGAGNLNGTGNALNNTLVGNSGNNLLNGGAGNDYMVGGAGNDIFVVGAVGDSTVENAGGGTDTVRSYVNWTLGANLERLELQSSGNINGTGNTLANTLVGNSGANSLSGAGGNDYITGGGGNDTLNGGAGNDTLIGGAGRDILIGGAGNDVFDFNLVSECLAGAASRDSINGGFSHGSDHINLATIDANALAGGNQAFSFIGSAAFTGVAGQLRYTNYSGTVIIDADVNGDSAADMQILVAGTNFMAGTDFIL